MHTKFFRLHNAPNNNKYIIFLSDGFPTTYISSSSEYTGYDPNTSSGTKGADGVFYDYVTGYYCSLGTSYSDKAAIRAREQADNIKNTDVKIFSIGVDVGGQTIDGYDGLTGLSIIDRTGTNYEIGSASSTAAYENWLKYSIGSGYYYASTDSAGLQAAYNQIFEEIHRLTEESSKADWVAEDPLPVVNGYSPMEFIGFYDQNGKLITTGSPIKLTGTSSEQGENTASFDQSSTTIDWDLKESGYTSTTSGSVTIYYYELVYRVRLQNENASFVEKQVYNTNARTTLTYKVFESLDGETIILEDRTLEFEIPAVHGYLVELDFWKVDPYGRSVVGAEFTLSHDPLNCYNQQCRGDHATAVSIANKVAVSGEDGKVSFSQIPSGHTYTLVETKVPEGYAPTNNTYQVVADYDTVQVIVKDSGGTELTWDNTILNITSFVLPNTGGPGTDLYTLGGTLLMLTFFLLYKKRQGKGGMSPKR